MQPFIEQGYPNSCLSADTAAALSGVMHILHLCCLCSVHCRWLPAVNKKQVRLSTPSDVMHLLHLFACADCIGFGCLQLMRCKSS